LAAAWGERYAALLAADNAHPPMTLRVDGSKADVSMYLDELRQASIDAYKIQWLETGITLAHPMAVGELPGFAEGKVSVQDAGAQLAAPLLDVRPGMRILDACAAPGGKTAHILELARDGLELVAVDIDASRLARVADNLTRLGRTAELVAADLRDPNTFWDRRPFNRILVDAPCSSTGVIRRHPDIKLLRYAADVPALVAAQLEILRAAVSMLADGGRLVYSTCSVLPEENQGVVAQLLAAEPRMKLAPMPEGPSLAPGAIACPAGVQLLPGAEAGTDGFYYACLENTTGGA